MTLQKIGDGIYVNQQRTEGIRNLDSVVFDCDGVLIDVSNSYDLTIKKTVDFVAKEFVTTETAQVTTEMIERFKRTGGFNDEVNVTYALILAAAASKKTGKDFQQFAREIADNADATGIESVEKYLDGFSLDLSEIKERLAYPSKRFSSPLSSIFDELFYGQDLYSSLYKRQPQFFKGRGLIENDVVIVTRELLDELHDLFGSKIAIVTGRGSLSARQSLKDLFDEFDVKNSRFLEDEPREMAKPNPDPLVASIRGMGGSCSLFVGDSMEDCMMAKKTDSLGVPTLFCGIYGTSRNPDEKRAFFGEKGADIVLESVSLLPKTLNLVRA